MRTIIVLCAALLGGCAVGIPDYYPPAPKPEPCQTLLYVDGELRGCISHEHLIRDAKELGL